MNKSLTFFAILFITINISMSNASFLKVTNTTNTTDPNSTVAEQPAAANTTTANTTTTNTTQHHSPAKHPAFLPSALRSDSSLLSLNHLDYVWSSKTSTFKHYARLSVSCLAPSSKEHQQDPSRDRTKLSTSKVWCKP